MIFIIPIICGIICAVVASSKGRSVIGWFFLGFLFGIFALVASLIVSNLKEAREKEVHVEMEQRRLREQLHQERIKTEKLRKYTQMRLDIHDKELQIDTRHMGHLLEGSSEQAVFGGGNELPVQPVPVGFETKEEKLRTRCSHCHAKFKVDEKNENKRAKCPKCGKPFVITRYIDSTVVAKCTSCGRKIEKPEDTYVFKDKVVCSRCNEMLREVFKEPAADSEGWYYQDGDAATGPFSLGMIKQFIQQGLIDASTYVWHESLKNWTLLGEVSELSTEIDHG